MGFFSTFSKGFKKMKIGIRINCSKKALYNKEMLESNKPKNSEKFSYDFNKYKTKIIKDDTMRISR